MNDPVEKDEEEDEELICINCVGEMQEIGMDLTTDFIHEMQSRQPEFLIKYDN